MPPPPELSSATTGKPSDTHVPTFTLDDFLSPTSSHKTPSAPSHVTPPPAQSQEKPFPHITPEFPSNHNDHDTNASARRTSPALQGGDDIVVDERFASPRRLYLMVMADFGLAFVWLCKFAVATPYFQHTLKAGAFLSHLVWIMGPLSGLIVAPTVGVLSDRCTSPYGRRRPFILSGALFCILGMLVFANAVRLTGGNLFLARCVAILAFGVLDFATNCIMFPSRALMGDLLPTEQQHPVQSAAAVVASVGEIAAGMYVSTWSDPVTHVGRIFAVASVLLAVTVAVSLVVCVEESGAFVAERRRRGDGGGERVAADGLEGEGVEAQADADGSDDGDDAPVSNVVVDVAQNDDVKVKVSIDGGVDDGLLSTTSTQEATLEHQQQQSDRETCANGDGQASIWTELIDTVHEAITNFPRPLVKVGIVYGLAWFLWFACLPYYSQWLGVDVLNGDPHAEVGSQAAASYQRGVAIFSVANVVKACLAMTFAFFYPTIISFVGAVGERVVFGGSFLLFSMALWKFAFTKDVFVAAFVIALGSVPFIVTQTIPVAIVVQRFPDNLASNLGVLNLFCVVPQLVDTLYTGKVAEVAGESVVLRVAAGWGFAAAVTALIFL